MCAADAFHFTHVALDNRFGSLGGLLYTGLLVGAENSTAFPERGVRVVVVKKGGCCCLPQQVCIGWLGQWTWFCFCHSTGKQTR